MVTEKPLGYYLHNTLHPEYTYKKQLQRVLKLFRILEFLRIFRIFLEFRIEIKLVKRFITTEIRVLTTKRPFLENSKGCSEM